MSLKKTPLHSIYAEFGAKTVEFGGWDMPVQYSSILQEHEAVRTRAGLFDVSHMGEFEVTGPQARAFVQYMITNDVSKLEPGMALYSPMTYEHGGSVDDLLVYCFDEHHFDLVVNAGNIDKDFAWLSEHAGKFDVSLRDKSDDIALLAVQGPAAVEIVQSLTDDDVRSLKSFRFLQTQLAGADCVVSRTGYTGEDGFEIYAPAAAAEALWRTILQAGEPYGILPCGLGCRDTLRLEARLPLYGHELTEDISPLEAGLGMFVKLEGDDFIGRDALRAQKEAGISRKLVGIQLLDRGIPRGGYEVFSEDGRQVGVLTSGTMSPTLKLPVGLALVETPLAAVGTRLFVDIRGKKLAAEVIKTPFYKRAK